MRLLRAARIGIEEGNDEIFSDFADGGDMWTGHGTRERRRPITFSRPFSTRPTVQVGMSLWDFDSSANIRADITAEKITERGFELVFRTWGDTRIARARMSWLAIGEVTSDDDWDVF